jgi:hypothetical protein
VTWRDLTSAQLKALRATLERQLRFHQRLIYRMEELQFSSEDDLMRVTFRAQKAIEAQLDAIKPQTKHGWAIDPLTNKDPQRA